MKMNKRKKLIYKFYAFRRSRNGFMFVETIYPTITLSPS